MSDDANKSWSGLSVAFIGAVAAVFGASAGAYVAWKGHKDDLTLAILKQADVSIGGKESAGQTVKNLIIWKKLGLLDLKADPAEIRQIVCDCDGGNDKDKDACDGTQRHPEACYSN